MKKIGVFTDTHGNLLALNNLLDYFDEIGCDEIIHLGDIIDIGPHSKECFDIITSRKDITCVLGNHDRDFVVNNPVAQFMSHVPTEHKQHVFSTLTENHRQIASKFPLYVERNVGSAKLLFCHYPFDWSKAKDYVNKFVFCPIQHDQTPQNFDEMMAHYPYDAIFFGHKHELADVVGAHTYVNVGSLGCHPNPWAQGVVIEYDDESWSYRRVRIPYDIEQIHKDMQNVPCGEQLYEFYFLRVLK